MRFAPPAAALLALTASLLTACGGAQGATSSPSPLAAVGSASPSPAPTPSLSPGLPSPAPVPAPPAAVPPAAVPPQAPVIAPAPVVAPAAMPLAFGLIAVNQPSVRGTVTVTPAMGSYRLSVAASGLSPGAHSVHLHFGNCPGAGVHILVLGTLVADGAGNGSMSAVVRVTYRGDGRFVIIYVGPSAGPLAACANLAGS